MNSIYIYITNVTSLCVKIQCSIFYMFCYLYPRLYYPKALLNIINKYQSLFQSKKSIDEQNITMKRRYIRFWAIKIKRRYRLRHLLQKIFLYDPQRRSKVWGYLTLVQYALQVVAASRIQKHVRGTLQRIRYDSIRSQNDMATYIQSIARCYLGKHAYRSIMNMRREAAITIQRYYRAWKGRKLAYTRYITQFERRQSQLDQIQIMQKWQSINNRFTFIQKRHRSLQKAALESERKLKIQREREVNKRIQSNLHSYQLERKIFEQQLKEYYDKLLQTHEQERIAEENRRQHDAKVRILSRRREFEKQRLDKTKRDEEKRIEHELQRKNIVEEWVRKAEVQSNLFNEFCLHCFYNPQTASERSLCVTIKGVVKTR